MKQKESLLETQPQRAVASPEKAIRQETQRTIDLKIILDGNPLLDSYLINYTGNCFLEPLLKIVDARHGLTRPEWTVIFCLTQHENLNAQQISELTGRPKSSISHAIKQLEKKGFLERHQDAADARRQLLELTHSGRNVYNDVIDFFTERQSDMMACLTDEEVNMFRALMRKLSVNITNLAATY